MVKKDKKIGINYTEPIKEEEQKESSEPIKEEIKDIAPSIESTPSSPTQTQEAKPEQKKQDIQSTKEIPPKKESFFKRIFTSKKIKDNPQPEYVEHILTDKYNTEEPSISQKIDIINNKLNEITQSQIKKKIKEYKLPSKVVRNLKKIAEKNKVLVILLKTNKTVQPMITDIVDGFISIDGTPHNCSMDFIYLWKGKYPCIVLNEWDLDPIGTKDYYEAVEKKRVATPVAVVIRMLKSAEKLIDQKKKFESWWILVGLAAIAIIYLFLR